MDRKQRIYRIPKGTQPDGFLCGLGQLYINFLLFLYP